VNPTAADIDVELLISRLSGPLDPDDQLAFRRAAERVLETSGYWGEGSIYRCLAQLWREYFHPLPDDNNGGRGCPRLRPSKLKSGAPLD
jgi:hypothetical protein